MFRAIPPGFIALLIVVSVLTVKEPAKLPEIVSAVAEVGQASSIAGDAIRQACAVVDSSFDESLQNLDASTAEGLMAELVITAPKVVIGSKCKTPK